MSPPDVVLVGYYGRGNFGDDVLMAVSHKIVLDMLPDARIALRLGTAEAYPRRFLGEELEYVPFGTRDHHHLIVHGGGGTFFDFSDAGYWQHVRNAILLAAGTKTFVTAENFLRRIAQRPRMTADRRVGIGVGVGTFTRGSAKLLAALPILSDFDFLWLRDPRSLENLDKIGVNPRVVVGSDLAFLADTWCPSGLFLKNVTQSGSRPKLGVILRDWQATHGETLAQRFAPILHKISARFEVLVISLDPSTDSETLSQLSAFPQERWSPNDMSFSDFAETISEQNALLTARAHGAICGACLGKPSLIVDIEPKLRTVHSMLPNASRLVHVDCDYSILAQTLDEVLCISHERVATDVQRNRALSEHALSSMISELQ